MIQGIAQFLERQFNIPEENGVRVLTRVVVAGAATLFVLTATALVAFESVFAGLANVAELRVGDVAPRNFHALEATTYTSVVLTEQRRQAARESISPVYDPPDPNIARVQTQLARRILDFINDVRRDPYAVTEQKIRDINQITALTLPPEVISYILEIGEEMWKDIDDQIVNVLERVMRESIREADLRATLDQLPSQVGVRFGADEAEVIVAIVGDLIRANRFENPQATEDARTAAAAGVAEVERSFERGQIVISEGEPIDAAALEALDNLGLLKPANRRWQEIGRAFVASVITMVIIGLYLARFKPELLYEEPRILTLLAVVFLLILVGGRFLGSGGQVYIYPTAALALLYVTISGAEIAVIGALGMALLMGMMADNSLEVASLVAVGGLMGTLTLSRPERLNNYFFAGLMIALANTAIVVIFNLNALVSQNQTSDLATLLLFSVLNGILAAAAAVAGMYIVTLLFNLPTSLKLLELSQPNQPMLQRLLREAPGSYQHSLQVANLSEQATNAIGGNAALVHVAALYHDIGKVLNPAFFTENQRDIGNPHDILDDPYRSASIIIGHVTEGDNLARQYRLPHRIRDFIREHHGTTQVFVFYQKAIAKAGGDESAVDIADFTYPGPRPQSRETAILMLADSCEATVRSAQLNSKKEIEEVIQNIFESKRKAGQLDDSGLTLKDLKVIQTIFVEMLQAVFHPRINYAAVVSGSAGKTDTPPKTVPVVTPPALPKVKAEGKPPTNETANSVDSAPAPEQPQLVDTAALVVLDDDDSPMPDVPPLPRTGEFRAVNVKGGNGKKGEEDSEEKESK